MLYAIFSDRCREKEKELEKMREHNFEATIKRIKMQNKILEKEKLSDSDLLEYLLLGIDDYSSYYRMGMKKALKHAIAALRKEELENDK